MNYRDGANMDKVLNEVQEYLAFYLDEDGSEFSTVHDAINHAKAILAVNSGDQIEDITTEDIYVMSMDEYGEIYDTTKVATVSFDRTKMNWEVR